MRRRLSVVVLLAAMLGGCSAPARLRVTVPATDPAAPQQQPLPQPQAQTQPVPQAQPVAQPQSEPKFAAPPPGSTACRELSGWKEATVSAWAPAFALVPQKGDRYPQFEVSVNSVPVAHCEVVSRGGPARELKLLKVPGRHLVAIGLGTAVPGQTGYSGVAVVEYDLLTNSVRPRLEEFNDAITLGETEIRTLSKASVPNRLTTYRWNEAKATFDVVTETMSGK